MVITLTVIGCFVWRARVVRAQAAASVLTRRAGGQPGQQQPYGVPGVGAAPPFDLSSVPVAQVVYYAQQPTAPQGQGPTTDPQQPVVGVAYPLPLAVPPAVRTPYGYYSSSEPHAGLGQSTTTRGISRSSAPPSETAGDGSALEDEVSKNRARWPVARV